MYSFSAGKYFPGNSLLHKLDPRLKIIANLILIIFVFLIEWFVINGIILIFTFIFFLISKLPKKQLWKMLKPVIFIGIFLFFANAYLIKGDDLHVLFKFWIFKFSEKSLTLTFLIMLRIYIMIIVTSLLISTTKPMALTRGIEDLLLPLKWIKIPVHIIAMIISIALRFIPTLLEETKRIMKAQASRGVDFKNGNIKTKTKSIITLIIPLFVSAFSKAEELSNAMESRGYNPYIKRTRYRKYKFAIKDFLILFFLIVLTVSLILLFVYKSEFLALIKNISWWK